MQAQELLNEGRLNDALGVLQQAVRAEPACARHRIFLFQLLAVLGQWDRALTQLNMAAHLDANALPMAQVYREAIRCEVLRAEIFAGRRTPLVFGEPQAWLGMLVEALRIDGDNPAKADGLRAQALEQAATSSGNIDGVRFGWLADADPRLGPVFEAVINGRYFWVPVERVARVQFEAPSDLRDTVWLPARFIWTNGGDSVALVPTRYSETVQSGDEALLMGRRTEWCEHGALAGRALGQRMLATDHAEYALMDVRAIEFDRQDQDG
ncbi:virulence protein SciE type [Massilia horti]|uniref:Virulence protein SciE type n=2 Tax=Massilia horti TaxID=2562153 RepID=A0A4Y9T4U9_9BURK|nr:virulence protein SciE type [Massilia horti]